MRVVEITSLRQLEAFRLGWEELWESCADAGPFQHPDWLLPWCSHLGPDDLWTTAILDADRLVALAPCFIHRQAQDGARQLTLLGNGISDQLDFLIASDTPAATKPLIEHMLRRSDCWDICDFRDLPAGSVLLSPAASALSAVASDDTPCPVLDLAGANDGLSGTIPARLLSNLRYATRRAGAIGRLHIGRAEESSISAALDVLFELHSSRWRTRGQDGVLSKTAIQEFHRDVARQFLQRDWLRLYVLRIGQDIVAASYGFCLRGKSYYYIGGFDPHFAKLSPGALIVGYAITDAVREQARTFDFLRGAEDYKYKWGARDRRQFRIRAVAAKSRATAASWK